MFILDKKSDALYKLRAIGYHDAERYGDVRFVRSKNYWALHYVSEGSGRFLLRDSEYKIKKGMFFLTPPLEPINYYSDGPDFWKYYFISAYPDSAIDVTHPLGFSGGKCVVWAKHPEETERMFKEFYERAEKSEDIYFETLSLLNKILSLEYEPSREKMSAAAKKADLIRQADEIIGFNYKNPEFSISDIAEILKLHPSALSRIYKEIKGETPVSGLIEMRLDYAAALLDRKSITISELCRECGFGDERYFMKRFKKKFGKTVGEYRRKN